MSSVPASPHLREMLDFKTPRKVQVLPSRLDCVKRENKSALTPSSYPSFHEPVTCASTNHQKGRPRNALFPPRAVGPHRYAEELRVCAVYRCRGCYQSEGGDERGEAGSECYYGGVCGAEG